MTDLHNLDLQIYNMSFEKILETENVKEALSYLKKRQSTIRCITIIEMLEKVLRGAENDKR